MSYDRFTRRDQLQREFPFSLYSARFKDANWLELYEQFSHAWIRKSEDASWFALAAIEAFFGWTEHVFIHLAILQGQVTSGDDVVEMAEADWGAKFKKAFDLTDKATKKHFDELLTIRRQLRNFMAHGAFGKESEAFSFHSKTGAVPVALNHKPSRPEFSLTPELAFEDAEAIAAVEAFISFMWSGVREPAKSYIQESELPLFYRVQVMVPTSRQWRQKKICRNTSSISASNVTERQTWTGDDQRACRVFDSAARQ